MNTQTITKQKYDRIIGGSPKNAEEKFPWLKTATFHSAIINITADELQWRFGVWEDGVWEDGVWEDGVWKGGTWLQGIMWSNVRSAFVKIIQKNGTLEEAE
jgi:hypothetical protein